ncbi:MAG: hypothetical protein WCF96_02015 [Eubacteriales bacterium]
MKFVEETSGDYFKRNLEKENKINHLQIFDKIKVGVVGIGAGAGVSFLSSCLAKAAAENGILSCVIELGNGSIYDGIGMDKRFEGLNYFEFFKALGNEESIRNKKNISDGINWVTRSRAERNIEISSNFVLKLVNNAVGELVICDFSGIDKTCGKGLLERELLQDMDRVIVVVDPLPSKLLNGQLQLLEIKGTFKHPVYVINKSNTGVNRNEMLRFLKIYKPIFIPLIPLEFIYEAEYTCNIPYSMEKIKKETIKPIEEILAAIFPKEAIFKIQKS